MSDINIPVHHLETHQKGVQLELIGHQNPYDFTQKHRHTYFEVMFFKKGGGVQYIDFEAYEVKNDSCYLIYPQQIHLLRRAPSSEGIVLQFQEHQLIDPKLAKTLQEQAWQHKGAVLFEEDKKLHDHFSQAIHWLQTLKTKGGSFQIDAERYFLQTLLFDLLSVMNPSSSSNAMEPLFFQFLSAVDEHFKVQQTVQWFVDHLGLTEKKLGILSKKHLGLTPLQVIHRRILLEARRLLVFTQQSHKEIAWELGFDSAASFSSFIKGKTGLTATEIQQQLAEIHK